MRLIEQILNLVAPHNCLGCGVEGSLLCVNCGSRLTKIVERCYRCSALSPKFRTCRSCRPSTTIYSVVAIAAYDGIAKDLLHKIKFERAKAGAKDIALALDRVLNDTSMYDVITYIPTAASRVRLRGYDQAYLIAKELSRMRQIPFTTLLRRTNSQRQVGQNRQTRHQQMQNAFVAKPLAANQRILLIDDVITTGATLESASKQLKTAGAKRVSAAVFAAA